MSGASCRLSRSLCSTFRPINALQPRYFVPNYSRLRPNSTVVNAAELRFGQPLHETHPHLLQAGERKLESCSWEKTAPLTNTNAVTPGITALEYSQRRTKLAAQLPANAIAVVAASDTVYRTGHVFYGFHQDPDFFYLTGMYNTTEKQ